MIKGPRKSVVSMMEHSQILIEISRVDNNESPFPVDRRGRGECAVDLFVLVALAAFGTSVAHGVLTMVNSLRLTVMLRLTGL